MFKCVPESDGVLQKVVSDKSFSISGTVDTSDHIYDYFNRLLFLHDHREVSVLVNELPALTL